MNRARHRARPASRPRRPLPRILAAAVLAIVLGAAPAQSVTLSRTDGHTRTPGARSHSEPLPTLIDGNGLLAALPSCADAPASWCRLPGTSGAWATVHVDGRLWRMAATQSLPITAAAAPAVTLDTFTTGEAR